MSRTQPKTIIFDFDGTIADSLLLVIDIFRKLTGWQGAQTPAELARLRKLPFRKVVKELKIPAYRIPSLLVRGRRLMTRHITDVKAFEGVPEMLGALHAQGYRLLVMSSNSAENVTRFLRSHGLEVYVSKVYGGVGLLHKAGSLRRIVRQERVDRQGAVYVGDEQRDIEASHKVHMRCIAVGWGYNDPALLLAQRPFALVENPQDILKVLSAAKGRPLSS